MIPDSTFSSVQFSHSVVSNSLQPHESQHARPPCPIPTPGVYSSPCPSSRWCHPTISSSVIPFSSCPQSLPTSGSFPMSQLLAWGGQMYISLITWPYNFHYRFQMLTILHNILEEHGTSMLEFLTFLIQKV